MGRKDDDRGCRESGGRAHDYYDSKYRDRSSERESLKQSNKESDLDRERKRNKKLKDDKKRDRSHDKLDQSSDDEYKRKDRHSHRSKDNEKKRDKDRHSNRQHRKRNKDDDRERKDKKRKSRYSYSSDDTSSSSSSEDETESMSQLERDREAVETLRDILGKFGSLKKEIRQMLFRLDEGEAISIGGVSDLELQSWIQKMLNMLGLRRSSKGLYSIPSDALRRGNKTLSILGSIFFEPTRDPRPVKEVDTPAETRAAEKSEGMNDSRHHQASVDKERHHTPIDSSDTNRHLDLDSNNAASDSEKKLDESENADHVAKPVMKGPMMPPKEFLAAAAAAAAAMSALEEEQEMWRKTQGTSGAGGGSTDLYGDNDVVGPMPLDEDLDPDLIPEGPREAEVLRIMKVIRDCAEDAKRFPPFRSSSSDPNRNVGVKDATDANAATTNPYLLLGVDTTASASDIKKKYLRLSLLIHPDKCKVANAQTAFQAAAAAAKALQDLTTRKEVDVRLEDLQLRKMAVDAAAAEGRRREWAEARMTPEEREASRAAATKRINETERASWMTEIPPDRRPDASLTLNQKSVSSFSQRSSAVRFFSFSLFVFPLELVSYFFFTVFFPKSVFKSVSKSNLSLNLSLNLSPNLSPNLLPTTSPILLTSSTLPLSSSLLSSLSVSSFPPPLLLNRRRRHLYGRILLMHTIKGSWLHRPPLFRPQKRCNSPSARVRGVSEMSQTAGVELNRRANRCWRAKRIYWISRPKR